jgi:outer membrane biosynthesis protein TonB
MFTAAPAQQRIDYRALAATVGFHALLLLLFLLFRYGGNAAPQPNVDGGGLEVNLGTSENGSGNDQPEKKFNPSEYSAAVHFKTAPEKTDVPKDILKSTDAQAQEVPVQKEETRKTPEEQPQTKPEPVQKPKYTYGGENDKGGNGAVENNSGKSEGNTTGAGDRGVLDGTPGATAYTGTPGNGSGGIGHTLSGRTISPDRFEAEFRESGKVVIHVAVNRDGTIAEKRVISSPSPQLTRIALDKLSKTRFSKSTNSEPQQFGDVTIVFKTH